MNSIGKPNTEADTLFDQVTTTTLHIQGVEVVDLMPHKTKVVLDAELSYYHLPNDNELFVLARALIMAHKSIDIADVMIVTSDEFGTTKRQYDFSVVDAEFTLSNAAILSPINKVWEAVNVAK